MQPATWSPADHPAVPDDPIGRTRLEEIGHLMVVPRVSGPLVDVDGATIGRVDDLDAAIDELFGAPTDESAGPLDAVLVLGGMCLAGWSLWAAAPAPVLLLGVGATLLGIALPVRSVAASSREARRLSARGSAIGHGLPLDASDPTVRALTDAYGECLAAASKPAVPHGQEAIEAAHLAVTEVASLLAGGRPVAEAEIEYVRKRTGAIGRLTLRLQRAQRARVEARLDASIHHTAAEQGWATALTEAREELESSTGLGSLDRLSAVGSTIEQEGHDVAR